MISDSLILLNMFCVELVLVVTLFLSEVKSTRTFMVAGLFPNTYLLAIKLFGYM